MFVSGKPFQPSPVFVGKLGAYPIVKPYPQTLDKGEKACQRQTLATYGNP